MTQKMSRHLIKCTASNPDALCRALQLVFTTLGLRTVHSSSTNNKNPALNKPSEAPPYGKPLFDEIVSILGTENVIVDREARLLGSLVTSKPVKQLQGACENAGEKGSCIETSSNALVHLNGGIEVKDVSPLVHRVTEIVRSENSGLFSMEERLNSAGFELDEEIVEMVLKRCFKVPHLALRFFNWMKSANGFRHTTRTYDAMIDVAGEAKDFGLMENLADEMERSSREKSVKTWTILISHYGKAKLLGKALLVFDSMKKQGIEPDAIAYRKMLCALCSARKADIALEFYKDMVRNNVEVDLRLYKELLKCLAMDGDTASVHLVGRDMARLSSYPESSIYGMMIKSFCISGRIREALELVRDMSRKNLSLDAEIFETLLRGLSNKESSTDDALEIVEIMKKRNVFGPKVVDILIKAHLRRNELSEAFNLLRDNENSGNVPVSTYTMLLQHLFLENEVQKGFELYEEMLEKEIPLDCLAITAVAMGYLRQNRVSEAWDLFKSMDERGIKPNSKACAIFLKELCKYCKRDEIIGFLDELKARKIDIHDRTCKQILSYLEKKVGETKKLDTISWLQRDLTFHPIREREPSIDQHDDDDDNSKMIGESEENQIRRNGSLSDQTNHYILEVRQILSSTADRCLIQEKLEKCSFNFTSHFVEEILRDSAQYIGSALNFFAWIREKHADTLDEKLYHLAIKIAGQGKNFREMRSIFHEMRRRGFSITSDTWTIMIMQYGKTGLTDIALSCFREMKLSGCKPTSSTYHCLITSLCGKKGRNVDEAVRLYLEMCRVGYSPEKGLIESYIGCLCEVGRLSDAKRCVESLSKFGFSTPLCYSLYIRALLRTDKWEQALLLMDETGDERNLLKQFTYASLIHSLLRHGRVEEAFAKIESMRSLGIHPTVHVYTDLIIHFLREKQLDKAMETLQEMKEKGCEPTIVTYSALICGYVRLGLVTEAWDVFRRLKRKGPSPDFKTYSMFIDSLCRAGKSEEAFELISEMLIDGIVPSTVNFRTVIYGLNGEGKPSLAEIARKKKNDLLRRRRRRTER